MTSPSPSPVPCSDRPVVRPGPFLLAGVPDGPGLEAHRRRWGALPEANVLTAEDLALRCEAVALGGRGGARFPFATKLRTVAGARRRPAVVVNGSEGEPASAKDAALLRHVPHLVLDGAAAAARALGAREVHVVLPGDRPLVAATVREALAERHDHRLRWRTSTASPRFVAGQSRAVLELLAGRENLPVTAWAPDAVSGLDRRPTLLSNAETWAHVGALALAGAAAYSRFGSADEPGTTLLSLGVGTEPPHVHEVEHGAPLADLVPTALRGEPVLVGGFHGTWVPWETVARATVSPRHLTELGAPLGAGVMHLPTPGACPLELTVRIVGYLAAESAGRCGPCVNGLPALAEAVHGLALGRPGARTRVEQLVGLLPGRGACAHPDGTVRLVRSTMVALAAEVDAHEHGSCRRLRVAS